MAEFCVSCWNELNETDYPEEAYFLSWDSELCEGCGEYKRVIIGRRRHFFLRMLINQFLQRKKTDENRPPRVGRPVVAVKKCLGEGDAHIALFPDTTNSPKYP